MFHDIIKLDLEVEYELQEIMVKLTDPSNSLHTETKFLKSVKQVYFEVLATYPLNASKLRFMERCLLATAIFIRDMTGVILHYCQ